MDKGLLVAWREVEGSSKWVLRPREAMQRWREESDPIAMDAEEVEADAPVPKVHRSVLDMLRFTKGAQDNAKLTALLRADDLARNRFVTWGVPMGRVEAERLRFRNWTRQRQIPTAAEAPAVAWNPSSTVLSWAWDHQVTFSRAEETPQREEGTPVTWQLPFVGGRLRWVTDEQLLVPSRSSPQVCVMSGGAASRHQSLVLECSAMTTMLDVVGTAQGLVFGGSRDGSLYLWDQRAAVAPVSSNKGAGSGFGLNCLQLSRDGQMLMSGTNAGSVDLWDVRKITRAAARYSLVHLGFQQSRAGSTADVIGAMHLQPDCNSRLAVQLADGRCSIFDLASLSATVLIGADAVRIGMDRSDASVSFLPGSPWLAAAFDSSVRLMHTGKRRQEAKVLVNAAVTSVACSSLGTELAFGMRGGTVSVFGNP